MLLNVKAFTYSCSIIYGLSLFLLTLWLTVRDFTNTTIILELIYPGYTVSLKGSLIGLFYGMIDGAIFGFAISRVYNFFSGNSGRKKITGNGGNPPQDSKVIKT